MVSYLNIGRILSMPFRLHSQTTAVMLFLFGLLIGSKHFFGTSVHCSLARGLVGQTVNEKVSPTMTELCKADLLFTKNSSRERKSQGYYQFVYVVLFAQAIACLIPAIFWKALENNRQDELLQGLKNRITEKRASDESDEVDVRLAAKYLKTNQLGRCYLMKYVLCLLLCLANLIGQIIFLNWFLGGDSEFSYFLFGFRELFAENSPLSPRAFLFQSKANCEYKNPTGYGYSTIESTCVLTLNKLNGVLYLIIWWWFALLFVLLVAELLYILLVSLACRWRGFVLDPLRMELVEELNLICGQSIGSFFTIRLLFNTDLFPSDHAKALVKQLYADAKGVPGSKLANEKQFSYNLIDVPHVHPIGEKMGLLTKDSLV